MLVGVGTLPDVTVGENQALAGPIMFNTIWGSLGNRFGAYSYLFLNFEMAQTLSQIYQKIQLERGSTQYCAKGLSEYKYD